MTVEGSIVSFTGESNKTFSFVRPHSAAPVVCLTPEGSNSDINIYVTSISRTHVVIASSEDFTGNVHLHAWST
jgi:hypothetical protein